MDRPSEARNWQPLLCERPKDTVVPNVASTASLFIASQTGLVPLDPDGLGEADGRLPSSSSPAEEDGDGVGDPLSPPDPAGTSAATVPLPSTTWAQAAAVLAASNRANPARIRRALIYRSSLGAGRHAAGHMPTSGAMVCRRLPPDSRPPCATGAQPTGRIRTTPATPTRRPRLR